MKTVLNEDLKKQILEMYSLGKTVTEIRNVLGIKWTQPISTFLKNQGLRDFKGSNRTEMNSPENIQKILELRENGLNVFEIGKELGFNHQFVTNVLKRQSSFYKKRTEFSRIYNINENYFDVIDTANKAYIIGFICADGYIHTSSIQFCLSIQDIEILEKIKKEIGADIPISFSKRENPYNNGKNKRVCEFCVLRLNSVKLVKSLSFIPKRKTYDLNSTILDNIPEQFVRDFLRGYFDGDGGVYYGKYKKKSYSAIVSGNKEFLENTFGKYFYTPNKLIRNLKSKQMYGWYITRKERVNEFLKYLYEDAELYLDRKYEVFKLSQSAHVKPIELLETQTSETRAISSEALIKERSETIETTC
jgi:intein-encoded DNA endonuclease-like protein